MGTSKSQADAPRRPSGCRAPSPGTPGGGVAIHYHDSLPCVIQRKARISKMPCFPEWAEPGLNRRASDFQLAGTFLSNCSKMPGNTAKNDAQNSLERCRQFPQIMLFSVVFQWILYPILYRGLQICRQRAIVLAFLAIDGRPSDLKISANCRFLGASFSTALASHSPFAAARAFPRL